MAEAKGSAAAPATTDHATLDITAIVRHVTDVESSLPPPRQHSRIDDELPLYVGDFSSCGATSSTTSNIDTSPDVRILQLPRHDRRKDETDFDDEDIDIFLVAARTSRVVGAGLVTISRQSSSKKKNSDSHDDDMGPLLLDSDFDDDGDEAEASNANASQPGYGDLADPMGGDRYGPVTICCAYCEDEDDEVDIIDNGVGRDDHGAHGNQHDDDEDGEDEANESDEMITCLAILALHDSSTSPNKSSQKADHHVAIVLGTSFGRVLSTELCVHHSRGIRRADAGEEGNGDPFEPLPLDYDDEDVYMYEYYDEEGRRQLHGDHQDANNGRDSSHGGTGDKNEQHFFHPEGGIKSIDVHADRHIVPKGTSSSSQLPPSSTKVSVTYGDGTCVRLPHYALFKSAATTLNDNPSIKVPIRRCRVNASTSLNETADGATASSESLFLPKSHPSPLTPPLAGTSSSLVETSRPDSPSPTSDGDSAEAMDIDGGQDADNGEQQDAVDEDEDNDHDYDFCEAVTYGCSGDALRFHSSSEGPPQPYGETVHGNEQSLEGGSVQLGMVTGAVVGVAAGVFGAAMGAVSWGLGGGKSTEEKGDDAKITIESPQRTNNEVSEPKDALSLLRDRHVDELTSGVSLLDPPRKVASVVIDPDGDLAATTDTLGRVLLLELETKQVLRIWKGVRDASCCWIQIPRPPRLARWGKKNQLYLAIHSGQRRVVEVWRVRHGPRVAMHSVGRDARLVPCLGPADEGALARCFILEPASLGGARNVMDTLAINDPELYPHAAKASVEKTARGSSPGATPQDAISTQSTGDAMQLQLLKQQLASETNVPTSPRAIYDTLTQIGSIADLSSALDVLSTAEHLEDGMGIKGSTFHSRVVEYCEKRLDSATNDYSNNSHLRTLKMKIIYNKQIISAYNVLNKFEAKYRSIVEDDDEESSRSSTPWTAEAAAWIKTYEVVTGRTVTEALPSENTEPLKFATFAKSCMQLTAKDIDAASREQRIEDNKPIHLIDSKRDRTVVLLRIFQPLLMDLFVFKVVNTIFDSLGITQDHTTLQRYFGEWFMALSGKLEAKKGLMVRWLQEMVTRILDEEEKQKGADEEKHEILLDELHRFCSSSDDLPRAFLLAAICQEAVSAGTQQKEAKTYGKVSSAEEVVPWDQLLRKLRVCLLITLRLSDVQLGSFPVNVNNIDDGGTFSIYQWVARDELSISHKHYELASLEDACRTSPQAFDPSSAEGDSPARRDLLQKVCRAVPTRRGDRASRSFVDSDQPGPLLLYLGGYNHPVKLAAHRALLLGEKWGKSPQSTEFIKDAVAALRSLDEGGGQYLSIATAVRIELWQTRIRPVYRALLFGFEDVPELSEDVVAPLFQDFDWIHDLGRVALDVLALIARTPSIADAELASEGRGAAVVAGLAIKSILGNVIDEGNNGDGAEGDSNIWPTTKDDVILRSLVSKVRPVATTSLEVHRAIVCAAKLTDDLASLSYCVPSLNDVFLQGSLFSEMTAPTERNEYQEQFLNGIVLKKVLLAEGQTVDHFELEEIENLGSAWGVERTHLRVQFLLHMYDVGKDHMVNDLANLSNLQLDFPQFVEGGLQIACARLHAIIVELKKAKMFRAIVGMLDADACKMVKREAEQAADHLIMSADHDDDDDDEEWETPPLSSTHALVLRVLRMSSNIRDSEATEKAHSLSILSGTLLNAVQENEELKEYGFSWAS